MSLSTDCRTPSHNSEVLSQFIFIADFGLFKVILADKLDAVTMYRLATVLGFSNAEVDRLGINLKGAKIISAMEGNATMSENDVSRLFTLLGTLQLIQLKRTLEGFATGNNSE